ncbi:uncharacterized protein CEXT_124081 [Caerostris extrusa]|uniref:Uncharacterized protein n=1 Tax=Caerostris extrusa TaxID=172846 RepID=A0AAV4MJA5_CAEEX|nr:uncharacterized protein CEXT_124081 [Caerostris extrusa]
MGVDEEIGARGGSEHPFSLLNPAFSAGGYDSPLPPPPEEKGKGKIVIYQPLTQLFPGHHGTAQLSASLLLRRLGFLQPNDFSIQVQHGSSARSFGGPTAVGPPPCGMVAARPRHDQGPASVFSSAGMALQSKDGRGGKDGIGHQIVGTSSLEQGVLLRSVQSEEWEAEPFAFKRWGFGNSVTEERARVWGGESAEEERKRPPGN